MLKRNKMPRGKYTRQIKALQKLFFSASEKLPFKWFIRPDKNVFNVFNINDFRKQSIILFWFTESESLDSEQPLSLRLCPKLIPVVITNEKGWMIKEKLLTKKIYGRLKKHGWGRIDGAYVYEYKRIFKS